MTIEKRRRIRQAGIVALTCAVLAFTSDVIMLGLPVSGDEISDYRILLVLPEWRLRLGGYGAFIIVGFVIGVWQLYEGIRPAGAWWSIPALLLLSFFFISGAIFHFLVPFIGAAVKQAQMQGHDFQTMETLVQTMQSYALVPYIVAAISLAAGSVCFGAAILFRATYFPKWMAAFSPMIPIGAAFLITRWLPAPFGGYLLPPFVHFATPVFFGLSTALLWNVKIDSSNGSNITHP
jgi:hypothetical protein